MGGAIVMALWKVILAVLAAVAVVRGWSQAVGELRVKPALMPFMEDSGTILVQLDKEASLHALHFEVRDEQGTPLHKAGISGTETMHTDRHGYQWLHLPLDLSQLPFGVSLLRVFLWSSESGVCVGSGQVKVVRAPPKRDVVVVDNVRGCLVGSDGLPFFPFGAYTYGVSTDVERGVPEEEAQFGMNWVAPYLSESGGHSNDTWKTILQFLDRCNELGVHVHYDLHQLATLPNSTSKLQLLEKEVKTVMDHPAVAMYYLADEPGGQHIDPKLLENTYNFVKSIDPHKPISMVFCCVDPKEYIMGYDVGMADPYPIPNASPESVALKTALLAQTGKPFFIVPQAFGGGEAWQRTPTPSEERVMTYVSVITGAVGIQYFVRSPHQFPYAPTAWSECRRLALELHEISSAILSGGIPVSVQSSVSPGVMATGWGERVGGAHLVAAVNYLKQPVNVTLVSNVSYSGQAQVVFQDRNISVVQGSITDVLPPYGSAVYRFPLINSTQVSPSNILVNPSFDQITTPSSPDGAYLDVPADLGSTYLTDSRVSVDGLHSLRLVTATANGGFQVRPYPVNVQANVTYEFSFWATSPSADLTLRFTFTSLSPTSATFHTDTKWMRYAVNLTGQSTLRTSVVSYELVDSGMVWLDLMQLIPHATTG